VAFGFSHIRIGVARGSGGEGAGGSSHTLPPCGQLTRCFSAVAELLVAVGCIVPTTTSSQTDRRHYQGISRSYCVAVRSAKTLRVANLLVPRKFNQVSSKLASKSKSTESRRRLFVDGDFDASLDEPLVSSLSGFLFKQLNYGVAGFGRA